MIPDEYQLTQDELLYLRHITQKQMAKVVNATRQLERTLAKLEIMEQISKETAQNECH